MKLDRFIRKKELVNLTRQLIQIPTENPPGNEKPAFLFLKRIVAGMGFRLKAYLSPQGRWNIVAVRSWGKGGRTLIFNGHLDVVPAGDPHQWTYPPFQGRIANGRIYGRGASDMKGGIASFLQAISMIDRSKIQLNKGTLALHLVSDEECHGHQGMGFLSGKGVIRGDAALVGEPTDLRPVIAQKGALWLKISTFGKSAHGSTPHLGENAIEKMTKVIEALHSLRMENEHPLLGKPTFNIGMILGGTKINVVPDRCEIAVDRRLIPGEKKGGVLQTITRALDSIQPRDSSFRYGMEEIDFAEPTEIDPQEEIVKVSLEAVQEVRGVRPEIKGFSGFTDGRFYIQQGNIPTLILGPGENHQPHTTDESIEVDALVQAAHIYGLIVINYLSTQKRSSP
jgi:succinyl-diaminopimelate desuccinylase